MRPRARAVLLACAALATATAPVLPALAAGHPAPSRPAAQSLTWTVTPSPDTRFIGNELLGISCTARGSHQLAGAAGRWPLFAVTRLRPEGSPAQGGAARL